MLRLRFEGKLKVVFFKAKDENNIVAYCSALDLSTCGHNIEKAKDNFIECLKIYLEETVKHGTLEKDLIKLGWKTNTTSLTMLPPHEEIYKNIPLHILKRMEIQIPLRIK